MSSVANPRRTRLSLPAPSAPGAPVRRVLDLTTLAREAQERRRTGQSA